MGFLKKMQFENLGEEVGVGEVDDGFVEVFVDDIVVDEVVICDLLKEQGEVGKEDEFVLEEVVVFVEVFGDQVG